MSADGPAVIAQVNGYTGDLAGFRTNVNRLLFVARMSVSLPVLAKKGEFVEFVIFIRLLRGLMRSGCLLEHSDQGTAAVRFRRH